MSLPIWTPAALSSEARPFSGPVWRFVEAQHRVSTLKLVDTLDEQTLLEELLEESKPVLPPDCAGLDYLLGTPFRYGAVYPHGSRFRRAGLTPGVFYGAEHVETALAEMAFYRLLFFAESPGTPLPRNAADYTGFAVALASQRAIDLMAPPYVDEAEKWTDPVDYAACQALADRARADGVEIIRYRSVREPQGRANLAVLNCAAFAQKTPGKYESWKLYMGPQSVTALRDFPRKRLDFARASFAADPRLPR